MSSDHPHPLEGSFRELIERSADGVLVVRPDGVVVWANPAAEVLLGRAGRALVGSMFGVPVFPGATTEIDLVGEGATEQRVAEMRVAQVAWAGEPALLATLRDVTERVALAQDNARLYSEAREALHRRDEFLAMLAHELRNPLAPILHAARLMKARTQGDERLESQRVTIERQGQHLSHLLDDLLDLSRVTHGKIDLRIQPTDLAVVIADAVQATRGLMEERRHRLTVEPGSEALVVDADATRLAQVLENLLNNAARYTPPGGAIELHARREGNEAVLTIRDNGEGIPAPMLSQIFEPFTQVHQTLQRAEGGLGIGLSLVRRLLELHHGRISVSSSGEGQGSTFEVRLPLSTIPLPAAPPPAIMSAASTTRKILVVEDHADGREMLVELLRLWGHEVESVGDGAAALERMQQARPDVALIDIGLPGLSGYELAQKVRRLDRGGHIVLIALTGYGQPEDRARSLKAGFDAHLVKPVDLDKLAAVLERGRK